MQDNGIKYVLDVVGAAKATSDLDKVAAAGKRAASSVNGTGVASSGAASGAQKLSKATAGAADATDRNSKAHKNFFGHIAKTTVLSAGINQLFLQFVDVTGQAIKQVDLINNFPPIMASMGQSTEEANKSLQVLRNYVGQIGGNLADATSYVTRFTGATGNVKAATAIFVGLNNALIAGDSSLEEQRGAMLQFAQALERGKIEAKEWNILTQNMSFQLNQVAKSMGFVSSASLREAMVEGKVSMADFTVALTKMSTGTGNIVTQAEQRMNGMQFAFNRMKNTVVQGLASIIDSIGRQNIVSFFTFLTQVVQVLTSVVLKLISALVTLLNFFGKLFGLPAIKLKKDAEGIAEGLGAGAGNAGDLKDGLDDAGDSAKKLNKSLASFDKMNVLSDKESGGKDKKDEGAGGAGFDAGQIDALSKAFGDISGGLQEVGKWAKILGGVLAGILATMMLLKGISWFNDTVRNIKDLNQNLKDMSAKAKQLGDDLKTAFDKGFAKGAEDGGKAKEVGSRLGSNITSGIGGALAGIGAALGPALVGFLAPIGVAIAGFFGVTIAAGVGAALLAAGVIIFVIVAIIAIIWVLWKNWDKIWGWMKDVADKVWQGIQKTWDSATKFFVDIWQDIYDAAVAVWKSVKKVFGAVVDWLKEWGLTLLAVVFFPITFMVATIILIVTGLYTAFKWLWDKIVMIFTVVSTWLAEQFQKAWDAIVAVWNVVVEFFQGVWDGIVAIFTVVASWLGEQFSKAWDAIVAVWKLADGWMNERVWTPIKNLFAPVVTFFGDLFERAWDGIMNVWNTVSGYFGGIWTNIKNAFGDVAGWFGNVFQTAWDKVTGIFSSLWTWFRDNVWNKIVSIFTTIGTTVADAISGAFKGVINTVLKGAIGIINGFFGALNGAIGIINKLPGVNIKEVPKIPVPQLARGGIVNEATMAMVGENGSEAVVPLENNTEWIEKLAAKINTGTQANTNPDIIPVTNVRSQPASNITINVSGVFATSTQEQKKVAELIAKQLEGVMRSRGLKANYA